MVWFQPTEYHFPWQRSNQRCGGVHRKNLGKLIRGKAGAEKIAQDTTPVYTDFNNTFVPAGSYG
jgi:hypothetical protein